jgi:hypothetical protein
LGFGLFKCKSEHNSKTSEDVFCDTRPTQCSCVEAKEAGDTAYYKSKYGASDKCDTGVTTTTTNANQRSYGIKASDLTSLPAVSVYKIHKKRLYRSDVHATNLRYSRPVIAEITGADDSPTSGSLTPFIVDGSNFGTKDSGVVITVEYSNNFYKADGVTDHDEMKTYITTAYPQGQKYPTRYVLKLGINCELKTDHFQFECTTAEGTGKDFFWRIKAGDLKSKLWPENELSKRTSYKQPVITTLIRYNSSASESKLLGTTQSELIHPSGSDSVHMFNTQGGEIMTIIGTDLGPESIPADLFEAGYGAIVTEGPNKGKNEFLARNCKIVIPHKQAECELVPGAGDSHTWRIFVDGSESTTPKSSFAPPKITSITDSDGNAATSGSCLGKEVVFLNGENFGEFQWDLESVTYGLNGREYVACQMKGTPAIFLKNWTMGDKSYLVDPDTNNIYDPTNTNKLLGKFGEYTGTIGPMSLVTTSDTEIVIGTTADGQYSCMKQSIDTQGCTLLSHTKIKCITVPGIGNDLWWKVTVRGQSNTESDEGKTSYAPPQIVKLTTSVGGVVDSKPRNYPTIRNPDSDKETRIELVAKNIGIRDSLSERRYILTSSTDHQYYFEVSDAKIFCSVKQEEAKSSCLAKSSAQRPANDQNCENVEKVCHEWEGVSKPDERLCAEDQQKAVNDCLNSKPRPKSDPKCQNVNNICNKLASSGMEDFGYSVNEQTTEVTVTLRVPEVSCHHPTTLRAKNNWKSYQPEMQRCNITDIRIAVIVQPKGKPKSSRKSEPAIAEYASPLITNVFVGNGPSEKSKEIELIGSNFGEFGDIWVEEVRENLVTKNFEKVNYKLVDSTVVLEHLNGNAPKTIVDAETTTANSYVVEYTHDRVKVVFYAKNIPPTGRVWVDRAGDVSNVEGFSQPSPNITYHGMVEHKLGNPWDYSKPNGKSSGIPFQQLQSKGYLGYFDVNDIKGLKDKLVVTHDDDIVVPSSLAQQRGSKGGLIFPTDGGDWYIVLKCMNCESSKYPAQTLDNVMVCIGDRDCGTLKDTLTKEHIKSKKYQARCEIGCPEANAGRCISGEGDSTPSVGEPIHNPHLYITNPPKQCSDFNINDCAAEESCKINDQFDPNTCENDQSYAKEVLIKCKVPPGEGSSVEGFLQRTSQKSLPFYIQYAHPKITKLSLWDKNTNKIIGCDNPNPITGCETSMIWENLQRKIPTVGAYVLVEGMNFGSYGPKAYLSNYPFPCENVGLEAKVQKTGDLRTNYISDMPKFFDNYIRTCSLEVIPWIDKNASVYGIQLGSPHNLEENWLHKKFLVKIPPGGGREDMILSIKVGDQHDINDEMQHSCLGNNCKLSYALPYLDVSAQDIENGVYKMMVTEADSNPEMMAEETCKFIFDTKTKVQRIRNSSLECQASTQTLCVWSTDDNQCKVQNRQTTGDYKLTINGKNFGNPKPFEHKGSSDLTAKVKINGLDCPIMEHNESKLVCIVPEGHGKGRTVNIQIMDQDFNFTNAYSYARPIVEKFELCTNGFCSAAACDDPLPEKRFSNQGTLYKHTKNLPTSGQCPQKCPADYCPGNTDKNLEDKLKKIVMKGKGPIKIKLIGRNFGTPPIYVENWPLEGTDDSYLVNRESLNIYNDKGHLLGKWGSYQLSKSLRVPNKLVTVQSLKPIGGAQRLVQFGNIQPILKFSQPIIVESWPVTAELWPVPACIGCSLADSSVEYLVNRESKNIFSYVADNEGNNVPVVVGVWGTYLNSKDQDIPDILSTEKSLVTIQSYLVNRDTLMIYDEEVNVLGEWGKYSLSKFLSTPNVLSTGYTAKGIGGASHTILQFEFQPGEGRDVPVKISISGVVNKDSWRLSYADPVILGVIFPQGGITFPQKETHLMGNINTINNGRYKAPASGCAEFGEYSKETAAKDVFNADVILLKKLCKKKAQVVIFGTNLGINNTVTFTNECQSLMEPIRTMKCPDIEPGDLFTEGVVVERSHFHVIVDLPVGVGSSSLTLQSAGTFGRGIIQVGKESVALGIRYLKGPFSNPSSLAYSTLEPKNKEYQCKIEMPTSPSEYTNCVQNYPKTHVWWKNPLNSACSCDSLLLLNFAPAVLPPVSLERKSTPQQFTYSKPDIEKVRFGPNLPTTIGDKFGAIGGKATALKEAPPGEEDPKPWRLYIFGENFGEDLTQLNITISDECTMDEHDQDRSLCPTSPKCPSHPKCLTRINSEPCLDARWHQHQKHDFPSKGRPFLSCEPQATTVGYKAVE